MTPVASPVSEQSDNAAVLAKAALRAMVTAAALRGLRSKRAASRRNPLYVPPMPERAAWQHVTGTFRAFADWASENNLALARQGMRNFPFCNYFLGGGMK